MAVIVSLHKLEDLAHIESKDELLLKTKLKTELHIMAQSDKTIIRLPYGNKFDIIDGMIIIHEK